MIVVLFISSFKSTGVKLTKSGIPIPVDSFGNEMCLLFIKYGRCRFKKKCKKSHWTPPLPGKVVFKLRETKDFLYRSLSVEKPGNSLNSNPSPFTLFPLSYAMFLWVFLSCGFLPVPMSVQLMGGNCICSTSPIHVHLLLITSLLIVSM